MVEAMPVRRIVRSVDAVSVNVARRSLRQIAVPHLIRVFGQNDAPQFAIAAAVEQAELDLLRVLGKDRKVDAAAVPGRAQRIGAPGQDGSARRLHAGSGTKISAASGGSVKTTDCANPCDGTSCTRTRPKFPNPLPPYASASVLIASRYAAACGTPRRKSVRTTGVKLQIAMAVDSVPLPWRINAMRLAAESCAIQAKPSGTASRSYSAGVRAYSVLRSRTRRCMPACCASPSRCQSRLRSWPHSRRCANSLPMKSSFLPGCAYMYA